MRLPNFFIVGAPKCGTSAMRSYLSARDDVFMCWPKEPHFYAHDIVDSVVRPDPNPSLDWYTSLFSEAGDSKIVGEASVFYLFSETAVPTIATRYPDARFLVMLRNPVDLVYSFFYQLRYTGQETLESFSEAWKRRDGREGSPLLRYGDVGMLGAQVERLFEHVERSRVHMILYDDFRTNTSSEYRRLLDFLDLPPDGRTDFPVVNANRSKRSNALQTLTRALPDPSGIKRLMGIERIGFSSWLRRLNLRHHPRPPLSPELRANVTEHFKADVALLGKLIERDLSAWE